MISGDDDLTIGDAASDAASDAKYKKALAAVQANPYADVYPVYKAPGYYSSGYNPTGGYSSSTAGKFAAGGAAASQCHAVSHSWQSTLLMILSLVLLFVFVDVVVRVWSFVRAKRITNRTSAAFRAYVQRRVSVSRPSSP